MALETNGLTPAAEPSEAEPCRTCPWRLDNHGKRHPDGWYTQRNRDRLWSGLRNGSAMSCHPTDPDNEVSPAAQAAGHKPAPADSQVLECRGGIILQQREVHLLTVAHGGDQRSYRAARPLGLTRAGIAAVVMRLLYGGVPLVGGRKMALPNLNAPVSHHRLPPWADVTEPPPEEGR